MRVDFYRLTRDPAEAVLPLIARRVLGDGVRLTVAARDSGLRQRLSDALWRRFPESFLAHGDVGGEHAERQPILLGEELDPANGARFAVLADGEWRAEAERFERVFLLFGDDRLTDARQTWRALGQGGGGERHFWKQDGGRWIEGP